MQAAKTEKRTFSPHFMSDSLGADYGEFDCEICHNTFYHSPSTIYQGETELHDCVCGHCTNKIIKQDHGSTPFQ